MLAMILLNHEQGATKQTFNSIIIVIFFLRRGSLISSFFLRVTSYPSSLRR